MAINTIFQPVFFAGFYIIYPKAPLFISSSLPIQNLEGIYKIFAWFLIGICGFLHVWIFAAAWAFIFLIIAIFAPYFLPCISLLRELK